MEQAQQIIPSSHLQSQLQSETNQSHMLQPHGGVGHGSVDVNDDRKLVKRQRIESHLHSHAHTQQGATPNQLNGFPYYPPASLSRGLRFDKSKLVSLLAEYFPDRSNLGTLVYNPTTTWETLQSERLIGLKPEHVAKLQELKQNYKNKLQDKQFRSDIRYIPVIPPLPVEYSNSLLEIKISRRFIEERRFSTKKVGKIWGGYGGIYTDDSDILTVLQHQGLFNGTIDLSIWNDKWEGVASPPDEGENVNDISVTLLLLPPLESYSGSYCNGVNPGTWSQLTKKNHNGLSFVVYNVKWESPGALARDKNLLRIL